MALEVLRFAQDFGSRLPLRSRLLDASSSIPTRSTISLEAFPATYLYSITTHLDTVRRII